MTRTDFDIDRLRRQSPHDNNVRTCDFCDRPAWVGYEFFVFADGDSLVVCDACLKRTRDSEIGRWSEPGQQDVGEYNVAIRKPGESWRVVCKTYRLGYARSVARKWQRRGYEVSVETLQQEDA